MISTSQGQACFYSSICWCKRYLSSESSKCQKLSLVLHIQISVSCQWCLFLILSYCGVNPLRNPITRFYGPDSTILCLSHFLNSSKVSIPSYVCNSMFLAFIWFLFFISLFSFLEFYFLFLVFLGIFLLKHSYFSHFPICSNHYCSSMRSLPRSYVKAPSF